MTGITSLDVFLQKNNLVVTKVEPYGIHNKETSLAPDTPNLIVDEGPSDCQVMIVNEYDIVTPVDLNIVIRANSNEILNTTERRHVFAEGVLIRPQKKFEIKESHETATIPLTVDVKAVTYEFVRLGEE